MNSIRAEVFSIESAKEINYIKLVANGVKISLLTLQLPKGIEIDSKVNILCKESEVSIGLSKSEISISNQIEGVITELEIGKVVTLITVKSDAGVIKSMITTDSSRRLNLQKDLKVFALIKANELSLELL